MRYTPLGTLNASNNFARCERCQTLSPIRYGVTLGMTNGVPNPIAWLCPTCFQSWTYKPQQKPAP